MTNPFKNNSLASGLLGYILGVASLAGGQALFSDKGDGGVATGLGTFPGGDVTKKETPFEKLVSHDDGDVFVSRSGKCYHPNMHCPSLRRAKEVKQVRRSDAESVGLTHCSKCY